MSELEILTLADVGDDRLEIVYTDGTPGPDPRAYTAEGEPVPERRKRRRLVTYGWVSATEQHFEPAAYGEDGHRAPDAEPRAMTDPELTAYALEQARIHFATLPAGRRWLRGQAPTRAAAAE